MVSRNFFILVLAASVCSTTGQPIGCVPCSCHHDNYKITISCTGVSISDMDWGNLPRLDTAAFFYKTKMAFHYLPANWRNLTTSMTIEDSTIEDLDLQGYYVLKSLTLSNVQVLSPRPQLQNAPETLQNLIITYSNIKELALPVDQPLKTLDLSGNQLTKIPIVKSVQKFNLANNSLLSISSMEAACLTMSHLTHFDLSNNRITAIPESAFECIIAPHGLNIYLNISSNKIREIHERAFAGLRIVEIDLNKNKLTQIGSGALDWSDLDYLNLQNNPWDCECNNQWMLDELMPLLYERNVTRPLLYDFRCNSPNKLKGHSLVYWLGHSTEVFCGAVAAFSFKLPGESETVYELWTGQVVVCLVLLIIIVLLIISIVAVWLWPKPKPRVVPRPPPTNQRPVSVNPRYSHLGVVDEDKF